jgi:chaperonin GroES
MVSDADPPGSEPSPPLDAPDETAGEDRSEGSAPEGSPPETPAHPERMGRADKVPVRMLSDRILVQVEAGEGERLSSGGILIPATAQLGKRLSWAEVRAVGPNVRSVQDGDQVLFNPEDVYEVEVRGESFIILRERDLHAVAAERLEEGHTGLYI